MYSIGLLITSSVKVLAAKNNLLSIVLHGNMALDSGNTPSVNLLQASGGLMWTAVILLIMVGIVSLRILFTKKRISEEINKISEVNKDL